MSLRLMKERMMASGIDYRTEQVNDAILTERIENMDDASYCDSFYKITQYGDPCTMEQIHPRLYDRTWSMANGHLMRMKTLIDEPVFYGDMFCDTSNNTYWICLDTDCVSGVDYISRLTECNYVLYWQKPDGKIVFRHSFIQNASSYNNGEERNNVMKLQSNQFMAYITYDDETSALDNGARMNICRNINICRPYILTRPDDISFGYGDKGVINIIFTQNQFDAEHDKLVDFNAETKVWICDYKDISTDPDLEIPNDPENPDDDDLQQSPVLFSRIIYTGLSSVKVGGQYKVFTGTFTDEDFNDVDKLGKWRIDCDFIDKLDIEYGHNEIRIRIDNLYQNLIGKSFDLTFESKDRKTSDTITVQIEAFV